MSGQRCCGLFAGMLTPLSPLSNWAAQTRLSKKRSLLAEVRRATAAQTAAPSPPTTSIRVRSLRQVVATLHCWRHLERQRHLRPSGGNRRWGRSVRLRSGRRGRQPDNSGAGWAGWDEVHIPLHACRNSGVRFWRRSWFVRRRRVKLRRFPGAGCLRTHRQRDLHSRDRG